MTECSRNAVSFSRVRGRELVADFSGGTISSDAGVLLLREADRRIAHAAAVFEDELFRLHEHAGGTATGVVDPTLVGGEHANEEVDDAVRRVELAAILPLGTGKLGEEVFVNAAEDALGPRKTHYWAAVKTSLSVRTASVTFEFSKSV